MKKSNPLISVIITTYNRYELLKKAIKKVYEQTYTNIEIIVSDDCSSDNTRFIKDDFPSIRYFKTPNNFGYTKNCKYALSKVKGDYIVFLADDDQLENNSFFELAIEKFDKECVDLVFARMQVKKDLNYIVSDFEFRNKYTTIEFLDWWLDVRTNYFDYFTLSCMLFKTDVFNKINPFISIFEDSSTIDVTTIISYVLLCKNIAFLDLIAYTWEFPQNETLSNQDRKNLVKQIKYGLSCIFDIENFLKNNNFDEKLVNKVYEVLNLRIEWTFEAIISEKHRLNNLKKFETIYNKLKNDETLYIYGRGWTGLELKEYLRSKNLNNIIFIDDYKNVFEDTISFDEFKNIDEFTKVIITSYKYKDIYTIYKKLNKIDNIKIYDLVSTDD